MFDPLAFTIPEAIDYPNSLVASYLLQTSAQENIFSTVKLILDTQSCGTWVQVSDSTQEIRERHAAKLLALWEVPDFENVPPESVNIHQWIFQVAYPIHNFGFQLPLMLTTAYGEVSAWGNLRLIDLHFPENYVRQFKGPKFGIAGVRELLNVPERPLVLSITKPPLGLTPDESAQQQYLSTLGGADLVKDDELLFSHPWSDFIERVKKHRQAAQRVFDQTGQPTLYFVNITDRPDRLVENAYRAIDAGASGLMVNYLTVGYSSLSMLADDPQINLPILAHLNFSGALYACPRTGVSSHLVLGKIPRLAGADVVVIPSPYGKFPFQVSKYLRVAQALTSQLYQIKPIWPSPGGGVHPGMVPRHIQELGLDFIISAGGAIQGHPMGPTAGARAFRQAIEAVQSGSPFELAAEDFPELKSALETWGSIS